MSNKRSIVLYMHVHQPKRVRPYTVFETANDHNYFDSPTWDHGSHNRRFSVGC